ncbi:globin domain-containing protein [Gordonia paraffinivorans]|uniref:nitric oxide dioxygenase n=1 Tax=Gordonia paraffinivorans TaxID=175628 RepID=A0ABD7V237_9ACTN|nr:globin domain-containing protein [Gordonia paraffinivorans]MCD2144999.1 FAD-binding oxidoreductase [Gordonia paraffinivorans]VFA88463.1 Xylene monooxygenase electron transfer component [Gordonia paraffinivorans]
MASHTRHALHQLRIEVNRDPERFVTEVYTRMFAIDPDLRDLFGVSMAAQHEAFHRVIDHVLEAIPAATGHTELVELLAQLGRDHRKYGVEPEHYHIMYSALMGEFAELMADYWDPETQQTISQAMMLVTGVMRGAAETATDPARWTAEVVEKYRITRDLAVVRLIAHSPLTFRPGQYLEVHVPQWPKVWRNLSPSIPPNPAGELEFHVRAIKGGTVSSAIVSDTRVGDVWTLAQSHGTLHVDRQHPVLMVAGGTGLAPLRALLIEMSKRVDNPPTHIFYGTRHPGELYDLAVLRRVASTNPWLQVTAVSEHEHDPWWINSVATPEELGIEHHIGTLADVVPRAGNWEDHQVLVAGSPQMIETTRRKLIIAGVRASRIQHDPVF